MINGNRQKLHLFCLTLCCALFCVPDAQAQKRVGDPRAAQYLSAHEPELKETTAPIPRLGLLLRMAPAALEAGDKVKARAYAREALALGEANKANAGIYGDSVHVSNIVLGRIALMEGSAGKARAHLLAAGRAPGSPVLKTFGPNMLLAKELIEKGGRDAVIEYLDLCAKFWEMQGDRLVRWKEVIRQGGMPDFGASLNVGLAVWRKTGS